MSELQNLSTLDYSSLSDQERERLESLKALRDKGVEPYSYSFGRTHYSSAAKLLFDEANIEAKPIAAVAGRITAVRRMGKASFVHILDEEGKIQLYFKSDELGEGYETLKLLDMGDIIGAKGFIFRT